MLNELQKRGQASRDDWYVVERIYILFFLSQPHLTSLQTCKLSISPQSSPGSTAALRVVGIETSRAEPLVEEPTPEWNDLAMSRLCIRETIISPCVGLASLNVCTRNSQTYI